VLYATTTIHTVLSGESFAGTRVTRSSLTIVSIRKQSLAFFGKRYHTVLTSDHHISTFLHCSTVYPAQDTLNCCVEGHKSRHRQQEVPALFGLKKVHHIVLNWNQELIASDTIVGIGFDCVAVLMDRRVERKELFHSYRVFARQFSTGVVVYFSQSRRLVSANNITWRTVRTTCEEHKGYQNQQRPGKQHNSYGGREEQQSAQVVVSVSSL
jgi:hypothetical protein